MNHRDKDILSKYVLGSIFCYGVNNAYRFSSNKSVFDEMSILLDCEPEEVAINLINYKPLTEIEPSSLLISLKDLEECKSFCRVFKLVKSSLTEFQRCDIYDKFVELASLLFNNDITADKCKEKLGRYFLVDSNYKEPVFINSDSLFIVPCNISLINVLLFVVDCRQSYIGKLCDNLVNSLNLEHAIVNLNPYTEHLSQFISIVEYLGIHICDVYDFIINQDIYPLSKYVFIKNPKMENQVTLLGLDSADGTFVISEFALMRAWETCKVNELVCDNNVVTIEGIPISKYLGVM